MTEPDIPETISTGSAQLNLAWSTYASQILDRPGVMIPDTDEDLSTHAFLGHSLDMQGWRAAEFVGVDELTKRAPDFVPLIQRGIGVRELGELWEIPAIREHLLYGTAGKPVSETLDVLAVHGGDVGRSFADAYRAFPWRKAHMAIRGYLQNSAVLSGCDDSFRTWLRGECARLGVTDFPPSDFRQQTTYRGIETTVEWALVRRLEETFYQVGPTMAPYMICDWQLWLWNEGRTGVFEAFKPDEFHIQFVSRYGDGQIPHGLMEFIDWWLDLFPEIPPRLANECIWLGMEQKLF